MNEIEEAIEILQSDIKRYSKNDIPKNTDSLGLQAILRNREKKISAYQTAIVGLQQQLNNGWISVIEKYPEEGQRVMVWDLLNNRVAIAYFSCPHWEADDGRINVIAWQPLPEPYKEVDL